MTIEIYGASDDLIEIRGDFREELYSYNDDKTYLAFSNGTLLSIEYDGEWKIQKHAEPSSTEVRITPAGSEEINANEYNDYTDLAEIDYEDEIKWVLKGDEAVKERHVG